MRLRTAHGTWLAFSALAGVAGFIGASSSGLNHLENQFKELAERQGDPQVGAEPLREPVAELPHPVVVIGSSSETRTETRDEFYSRIGKVKSVEQAQVLFELLKAEASEIK